MRYLYGDLTEARCQEDTLRLLQKAVDMSVDVLKLQHEAEMTLKSAQREKEIMVLAVGDIDSFQGTIQKAIDSGIAGRPQEETVSQMGRNVAELLARQARESKAHIAARVEEHLQQAKSKNDQLATQAFGIMKGFFMSSNMSAVSRTLHCSLDGMDYVARSEIIDAAGICCNYALDTSSSDLFSSPKRFVDLLAGKQELSVGTKKGWMKKAPVPVMIRVDDARLTQIMDGNDDLEYRLAPRPGQGVSELIVRVAKERPRQVEVYRVDDSKQTEAVPGDLFSREQVETLVRFSKELARQVQSLYSLRKSLLSISLDGKDVFQQRTFVSVVNRLIQYLGPIVREMNAHNPNQEELALKIEHEEGRREEFFLRKKNLGQRIALLPEILQALFEPLGLGLPKGSSSPVREVAERPERIERADRGDETLQVLGLDQRVVRKSGASESEPIQRKS